MAATGAKVRRKPTSKAKGAGNAPAELSARVAAIIALAPGSIDVDAIRTLLGNPAPFATQQEIVNVIRPAVGTLSVNTFQRSWRSNGCPGEAGNWNLSEILAWWFKREATNANRFQRDDATAKELAGIEIAMARCALRIRQAKADQTAGQFVAIAIARSELATVLSGLRDSVMTLPDRMRPMFPSRDADKYYAEAERHCRLCLEATADRLEAIVDNHNGNETDEHQ